MVISVWVKKMISLCNCRQHWVLAGVFLLIFIISLLFYYQYVYVAMKYWPESQTGDLSVDQKTFDAVFGNVAARENVLKQIEQGDYSDPFRP